MSIENEYLILRLDAPMQSWGAVAMDPIRPSHGFPTRAALAGMFASALGWRYRDGAHTTALQDALRYAVREERPPRRMRDYQTADLGRIGLEGWTRWGTEKRGGASATDTHLLEKQYLADGVFTAAVTLTNDAPVDLSSLEQALQRPFRPLFLGRKGCIPASPVWVGRIRASSGYAALERWPMKAEDVPASIYDTATDVSGIHVSCLCWYADGDGPDESDKIEEIWDRRDFLSDRFGGSRLIRQRHVRPPVEPRSTETST